MTKPRRILIFAAITALQSGTFAAETGDSPKPPSSKVGEAVKAKIDKAAAALHKASAPSASPEATSAVKAMPMYSEVTTINATGKSFTHKNKDGTEVKFVVTEKTEIRNGAAAAKFEDIKVGDFVSGLRLKKSETEYEVVKISKFGPRAEKKAATPSVK